MKCRILLLSLLAMFVGHPPLQISAQELKIHPAEGTFDEAHRFVFFAVLEGCYNDGVTMQEIDLIIPLRPEKEDRRNITTNLVLYCPLCSPVFDAFRLYSDKSIFVSKMSKTAFYNTFGQGLDAAVLEELSKEGKPRRDAVEGLVRKWIEERFELLNLAAEEEASLREDLSRMSEEGEAMLERLQAGDFGEELQANYKTWKECPVCSGASGMGVAQ